MSQDTKKVPDCKICLMQHDEDIHQATLHVRQWFFAEVTKHFEDDEEFLVYEEAVDAVTAA